MRIKMTGSSGYLGGIIANELIKHGHHFEGISRKLLYGPVQELAGVLEEADVVIHLAGAPVLQRWTEKNKKEIYDSRIITTGNLADAIKILPVANRPQKVISASGISIYANGKAHTEKSRDFDHGFLGTLTLDWEAAWEELPEQVSLTIFRTAVVLGRASATIQKMKLPFKAGVGGKIGSGEQPFPFIHERDVAQAYLQAVENPGMAGIFNLAAPQQITNNEFTLAMSRQLNRPAVVPVPAFGLKLVYGEAAVMLTESPAVIPDALTQIGFKFKFPDIKRTLNEIFA
jgi:uncharacterized protein